MAIALLENVNINPRLNKNNNPTSMTYFALPITDLALFCPILDAFFNMAKYVKNSAKIKNAAKIFGWGNVPYGLISLNPSSLIFATHP